VEANSTPKPLPSPISCPTLCHGVQTHPAYSLAATTTTSPCSALAKYWQRVAGENQASRPYKVETGLKESWEKRVTWRSLGLPKFRDGEENCLLRPKEQQVFSILFLINVPKRVEGIIVTVIIIYNFIGLYSFQVIITRDIYSNKEVGTDTEDRRAIAFCLFAGASSLLCLKERLCAEWLQLCWSWRFRFQDQASKAL
jgi:hypothetical protein